MSKFMLSSLKVLVSGAGGDIGQSVGKILRDENGTSFGIDINLNTPAQFIFTHFAQSIRCRDEGFYDYLADFITEHEIQVYVPIAEPEIRFFLEREDLLERISTLTRVVIPNREALEVGFDKLKTVAFLEQHNLPAPQTIPGVSFSDSDLSYPFILKSRFGAGGKGLHLVESKNDWDYLSAKLILDQYIAQELVGSADEEYTCGLFRSRNGEIRSIIFQRELSGGYSSYGRRVENEQIESLLIRLATGLDLEGSINVQLRLQKGVPYIFEINPRFSSTVYFRKLFGFNDFVWSVQDVLDIPVAPYEPRTDRSQFFKGYAEYVQ